MYIKTTYFNEYYIWLQYHTQYPKYCDQSFGYDMHRREPCEFIE